MMDIKEWTALTPRKRDALIARKVFGLPTVVYRDALGESLYVVDPSATRDGNATLTHLIGASWQRGYDANGVLVNFYGRLCPAFSQGVEPARMLEDEIGRRDEGYLYSRELCFVCGVDLISLDPEGVIDYVREDSLWSLIRATPEQRCLAALRAIAPQSAE